MTGATLDAPLAPAATAERAGVAFTLLAVGCAVFCVTAAMLSYLTI